MLPKNRIVAHPGEILEREFLEPLKITQAELARKLGISKNRVNELVNGKRGVSAETALLFSTLFKNSPEFWMNLQSARDLTRAMRRRRKRTAA